MDKAKSESKTFVNNLRGKAEGVFSDVQSKLAKARSGDLSAPEAIHQLQMIHLCMLVSQTLVLYLEEGLFSVSAFFPLAFLLVTIYIVAIRWHQRADSQIDMKAIIQHSNDPKLLAVHSIGLFGGFIFSVFVNMFSPNLETILGSFFYNMLSYLSILIGAMTAGFEVYHGAQGIQK